MRIELNNSKDDFFHFIKEIQKKPKLLYLLLSKPQNISLFELSFFAFSIFNILIVVLIPTFPITRIELILLNLLILCLFILVIIKSSFLTSKLLWLKTHKKVEAITLQEEGLLMHIKDEIIPIHKCLIQGIIETENYYYLDIWGTFIKKSLLIKKTDVESSAILKDFIINIRTFLAENKYTKKREKFNFVANIILLIFIILFILFLAYIYLPNERAKNPSEGIKIELKKTLFYAKENTPEEKLKLGGDIPIAINGVLVSNLKNDEIEKMLIKKNIKLTVLKKETNTIKTFLLNSEE